MKTLNVTAILKHLAFFGAFMLLLTGVCLAADQAAAAVAPAASPVWTGILKGVLAGAVAAVTGYFAQQKAADGTHEPFDVAQFAVTVAIGAGFGAYAGWKNLAIADIENLPIVASVVAGIEMLLKVIWRNGKVSVQKALTTAEAGNPTSPALAATPSTPSPVAAPK